MIDSEKNVRKFSSFMWSRKAFLPKFNSPMAVYDWFLSAWGKPLKDHERQSAYLAAWQFSLATGVVKL